MTISVDNTFLSQVVLTPIVVVNECSSMIILGSMLTENEPELRVSSVHTETTGIAHLKSLFRAPTYSAKSALSTSSLTGSSEFAPA